MRFSSNIEDFPIEIEKMKKENTAKEKRNGEKKIFLLIFRFPTFKDVCILSLSHSHSLTLL
jgi:hypothetical protein